MRQLVKNGAWQVPVAERPNGWQSLGVCEPSQIKIVVPGELDIRRCDCGQHINHKGQCSFRILRFQAELVLAVTDSAMRFGAEEKLLNTALVMVAGLYTRDPYEVAQLAKVKPNVAKAISTRLERAGIWKSGGLVLLGELEKGTGDMEFWLVAMAGAEQIQLIEENDGRLLFAHAGYRRDNGKEAGK